ncbi:MAG: 16S rRNA (cytosine(1402)-N(4))-methyltransferase RsmH [Bacilli bacterium]
MAELHIPVLLNEVIKGLNIKKDGTYLDLTLGRGGHSRKILENLGEKGQLISLDQDQEAIDYVKNTLGLEYPNLTIVKSNFKDIDNVLKNLNIMDVDGVMLDLGVSSPQFDEGDRGFSYKADAPLDMRMDKSSALTAEEIVNTYSISDLTRVIRDYGEDKFAYQITKNIIRHRDIAPIKTTGELVEIIKESKPDKELRKKGHPAKQTFQALRIEVNNELNVLSIVLNKLSKLIKKAGRICVITFQPLEDKIVKEKFKELCVVEGDRMNFNINDKVATFKQVSKKPIAPNEEEISTNNRSRTAKLRIIEKI